MRLIDADELEPDTEWDSYYDGFIAYSEFQIKNAPTIEAVPMSVIDDIKAEIKQILNEHLYQHEGEDWRNGLIIAEDVIDKHISGKE